MTDIRELLELAARAMGYKRSDATTFAGWNAYTDTRGVVKQWEPDTHSGDCADMCAALGINSEFYDATNRVVCSKPLVATRTEFTDHHNNRSAAWRMAALRVAAEIGRAKG